MTLVYELLPQKSVICGPGIPGLPGGEAAVEKFRDRSPAYRVLLLFAQFSTADAGQAGVDLVNQVQSLLGE